MSELDDVKAFQEKFNISMPKYPDLCSVEIQKFRAGFLSEEAIEYAIACDNGDMVRMFDSLIDIVYVALGTALMHGFPWQEGWNIVHLCNMLKQRAKHKDESTRNSSFDVIKPEGWKPPENALAKLLTDNIERGQSRDFWPTIN